MKNDKTGRGIRPPAIKSLILGFLLLIVTHQVAGQRVATRGIYGHPRPLWDQGTILPDLGVNAIFVHGGSVDSALVTRAKAEGLKVYAEFPTLNGKGYVEQHPEAWAINEQGERVEAASWFMGVCPTDPGFREYRYGQLRKMLENFDVDGIWMDYVHWHAQFEEPEPILPETCFCPHCLASFSEDASIELPEGSTEEKARWILQDRDKEWRDWRCQVIAGWAVQFRNIIDDHKPGTLLGLYHCPWDDEEFAGARRRVLGLDYDLLRDLFDVFSPMVYHARMGREPAWVAENISWFCDRMQTGKSPAPEVWPIVQAYNNPYTITAEEFEAVLRGGMTAKASGIMMFTTNAIAEDKEKAAVVKKVYHSLKASGSDDRDTLKYVDASTFPLVGKGFPDTGTRYERLPAHLKGVTRDPVWALSTNCSGLAVRFRTDSRTIAAKWEVTTDVVMNHFAPSGIKGLDLYCLENGKWQFVNSARPSGKSSKSIIITQMAPKEREFMLYLPLYDGLAQLEIGVEPGASLGNPLADSPRREKPVVFYGTSITQGGCASRAGMAYPAILSRMLNRQTINLGFSGNGKLDPEIARVMATIDASCFVIDCLPNVTLLMMQEKYLPFLKIIREKNPGVPILLVENLRFPHMAFDENVASQVYEKNRQLRSIYKEMRKRGDRNIHLMKGDQLAGDDFEATVDGVHLTDLGFLRMAQKLFTALKKWAG